jgi:DNA repair photolyase
MNIADLLYDRLREWSKSETIYFGSRCDPYMPIEEKYGLTRKCLSILNKLGIKTMITTKSDNNLIYRDIDILSNFNTDITVLMGMSNINQIGEGVLSNNIITANKLVDSGISVWGFITPVLPFIMDVDEIIEALNENIPIYLDKLMVEAGTIQAEKIKRFIWQNYPEYDEQYHRIIYENDESYYDEIKCRYANDSRVTMLFGN